MNRIVPGTSFPDLGTSAPISEALIDIFCSLPADLTLEGLRALHTQIVTDFPIVRSRKRWQGQFTVEESGIRSSEKHSDIDGWLFESADQKDVVQFRLDGFTVNRLQPYCGWEKLAENARRLWEIYRSGARPVAIQRVGVRYLNRIKVPDGADLDDYFAISPRLPDGLTTQVGDFLVRLVLPDQATGGTGEINFAVEPGARVAGTHVILDIGAYRAIDRDADTGEIWDTLGSLRVLKNRIFFGSLTARTKEMLSERLLG